MTKSTAKTLTLTIAKAPRKAAAPLAVPKTATSYILEGEAAAKVTVVRTRSRLAAMPASHADVASVAAMAIPAPAAAAIPAPDAAAIPAPDAAAIPAPDAATIFAPDAAAIPVPTVLRKRVS